MVRRLSTLCFLTLLWAAAAHAQYDNTGTPDKGQVYNVSFLSSGCTMDMTPDQCMAAGSSSGSGCSRCVVSAWDNTGHLNPNSWCGPNVYSTFDLVANCKTALLCTSIIDINGGASVVRFPGCTGSLCYVA
jgi:hypothetical protein